MGESLKVDRQINQELICVCYALLIACKEILFYFPQTLRRGQGSPGADGKCLHHKSLGFWLPGSFPTFSSEGVILIIKT